VNVLTIGTFDRLHVGHLELLAACRSLAGPEGTVSVAVNHDEFVTRFKGVKPQPLAHRLEMLRALRVVDAVMVNLGDEDARPVIELVSPDILAIGADWLDPGHDERRYFRQLGVTPEWMAARGLRVTYVPRTRGVSSSALRATA
jgi:glycerol-3-phosphate cytidylyltransferase